MRPSANSWSPAMGGTRLEQKPMAVDMNRILKGKVDRPPRVVVYGFDGVGKTGFAAGAPNVFFLDANKGSFKYNVDRVLIESWDETYEWLVAIENGEIKCDN